MSLSSTPSTPASHHTCRVCSQKATSRCARCKAVWYCSVSHQRQDWKTHKIVCDDTHKADQLTLHKKEFDRIVKTYQLDSEEKSSQIAELLTNSGGEAHSDKVSPAQFAETFGMKMEEAVVFLEWIKVGIKFKEESIDTAKKSGFASR